MSSRLECRKTSIHPLSNPPGESIQIFAEIENCSSRMVVPKAAIYQTQTFYAKGKMKEVKQLVANLRGESLSSGKTETWSGKMLKIPPVSPSILDCSIIRVEYSLMVSATPFGGIALSLFASVQRSLTQAWARVCPHCNPPSPVLSPFISTESILPRMPATLPAEDWVGSARAAKSGPRIAPGVHSTCR